MKRNNFITFIYAGVSLCVTLLACSEDKGNYDYSEENHILISGISKYNALISGADYLVMTPEIISSIDGEIEANNPNYEFAYQRKADNKWIDMCNEKDINILADMGSGNHTCIFTVTDKRTKVKTIQSFNLDVKSVTSEGWMVLCNEGPEEKLRMDMLANVSVSRIFPVRNALEIDKAVPELKQATKIGYFRTKTNLGDDIMVFSKTGAYIVPTDDGGSSTDGQLMPIKPMEEVVNNRFLAPTKEHLIDFVTIPVQPNPSIFNYSFGRKCGALAVSEEGNAFAWFMLQGGGAFEFAVNTPVRGEDPEYRVAPHIGRSLNDPDTAPYYGAALLYDIDNHRFIGWDGVGATTMGDKNGRTQICTPLEDPENKKFSYKTGNMELVTMLSTANDNQIYSIMKDGDKRHVYVVRITLEGQFEQVAAYTDIQATHFKDATHFAASSQYPIIYYAYKNKVYSYNVATKEEKEAVTLPEGEEVTLLKFNIYEDPFGVGSMLNMGSFLKSKDELTRQIYIERTKELMVGSYNTAATDNNGGVLRFYKVGTRGLDLTLKQDKGQNSENGEMEDRIWEYKGFARIVDVTYKEKR